MIELSPEIVIKANMGETYEIYHMYLLDFPQLEELYPDVRFGVNGLRFDIYQVIHEELKPLKRNKVRVGKYRYDSSDVYSEIERRKAIIKNAVMKIITSKKRIVTIDDS